MQRIHETVALRVRCEEARRHGKVGLVLTMGALHDGHLALMRRAREETDFVIATVFVNPTQFGPSEDFSRYPRELELDADKCASVGVDVLFTPSTSEMYPPLDQTRVRVGSLADRWCGAHRPGHFEGVCTVVAKFFGLCAPCVAFFGEKDLQQLRVLQRMAQDLFIPVDVKGVPTVREADGLAMSSRNRYLTPEQRETALGLWRALTAARELFFQGERRVDALEATARSHLAGTEVEYANVVDDRTLERPSPTVVADARLMIAARVGATRLIDNGLLTPLTTRG